MATEEQLDVLSLFGVDDDQERPAPRRPPAVRPDTRIGGIKKSLRKLTGRFSLWEVWRDWIELSALTLSQATDRRAAVWDAREGQYLRTAKRYDAEEMGTMAEMLGELVLAFEDGGPRDVLGELFQQLELASKWAGQFFTPVPVAHAMAKMTLADAGSLIERRGFVTLHDPAVGAGALPIGAVLALQEMGYGPQNVVVFGQDVDAKAISMAYVQLGLLGVPAVLLCADTLRRPLCEADWMGFGDGPEAVWYTPAFVMGGWRARLVASGA